LSAGFSPSPPPPPCGPMCDNRLHGPGPDRGANEAPNAEEKIATDEHGCVRAVARSPPSHRRIHVHPCSSMFIRGHSSCWRANAPQANGECSLQATGPRPDARSGGRFVRCRCATSRARRGWLPARRGSIGTRGAMISAALIMGDDVAKSSWLALGSGHRPAQGQACPGDRERHGAAKNAAIRGFVRLPIHGASPWMTVGNPWMTTGGTRGYWEPVDYDRKTADDDRKPVTADRRRPAGKMGTAARISSDWTSRRGRWQCA
jgi:hypothetical protein